MFRFTHRAALTTAAAVLAASAAGAGVAAAQPSHGDATRVAAPRPVVAVSVTSKGMTVSTKSLTSGKVEFDVTTTGGSHTPQLLRLHHGYSFKQLRTDVNNGVDRGHDVHAIRRLDHRVTWLNGVAVSKNKPADFLASLRAGAYWLVDQSGPGHAKLHVTGNKQERQGVVAPTITGTAHHRWISPKSFSDQGWIRLKDTSDESHFLILVKVKKSTTKAKVRKFVKSRSHKNPSWLLKEQAQSGVISRATTTAFTYDLSPGKYLEACFWPSDENGMPHFFMGMWKLVHLT